MDQSDQNEVLRLPVPPELAEVVRVAIKGARLVPGSVAVGGTVCSLYAGHRLSLDVDFVLPDLRSRFDQVRESLESDSGWSLSRVRPPVLILGSLDHVPLGYRQLRRPEPLDTVELSTPEGNLPIPTLAEILRVKAFLASDRGFVRDFHDFAELALLLPHSETVRALLELDAKWSSAQRPGVVLEVMKSLADCQPMDDPAEVFRQMKFLRPRLSSWDEVQQACRRIAGELASKILETD